MPDEVTRSGGIHAMKLKPIDLQMKGDINKVQQEIIKGRILEAALKDLRGQPGFNPAALSIVFGLKW